VVEEQAFVGDRKERPHRGFVHGRLQRPRDADPSLKPMTSVLYNSGMTDSVPPHDPAELVAGGTDGGRRLDEFLATTLSIGRRAASRLAPRVRVNGRRADKGQRLQAGDVVALPHDERTEPHALDAALEIVRATEQVLVLAKPAGLPSVALRGSSGDSLAARIAARFPECAAIGGAGEAGLAHRLDTGTSGILLAARSAHAYAALRAQFGAHRVEKEYLALVAGRLAGPLHVTTPIGQHHNTRSRMRALSPQLPPRHYTAHAASTAVTIERLLPSATLVRARTTTGVRHQIRVHLASVGHPLLNDPLYGERKSAILDRFLLHAARITWRDPSHDEVVTDELPPPEWWEPVLEQIEIAQ
jgi:23S rRNA pseudouridine1911/1915/1917 synthase